MNEIAIRETDQLAISYTFEAALQDVIIKECSDLDIAIALSAALEKAWFDIGLKPADEKEMLAFKTGVMAEVKACFTTLTRRELINAIYHGARGKYGEVFGMSVVSVAKWFAAYMTDQARIEARNALAPKTEPSKKIPSPEEIQQANVETALNAFEKFKANHEYKDYGNLVYGILDSLQIIPFTSARKKEFITQAIDRIKQQNSPAYARNLSERNSFKRILEGLLEKENNGTIDKDHAVIAEAKRIALFTFFKDLIEMDTELSDLMP